MTKGLRNLSGGEIIGSLRVNSGRQPVESVITLIRLQMRDIG